jgi:hypothetical protein
MVNIPQSDQFSAKGRGRWSANSIPCYVCAKPIRKDRVRFMLHVHCGGGVAVTEDEATKLDARGDLGCHPIGSDCLRRHPELKPYAIKWHRREGS